MEYTKKKLCETAIQICMPILQRTADRLEKEEHGFSIDRAGYACSELENICRPFMGIAPVMKICGTDLYISQAEGLIPVQEWIKKTLMEGCDKSNPHGFERGRASTGDNFFYNQSITELSCLLVVLYMAREVFWDVLSQEDKDHLARPLLEWSEKALADSWPNNHLWFPILALSVMKQLGYEIDDYENTVLQTLDILDEMYLGHGWYKDGEFGRFDYYIAWSHHLYPLLWTLIEDESFRQYKERKEKYQKRTEEYIPYYMHLFDTTGANVLYGRSLSYRFAASSLFSVGALAGCRFDYGAAKKIMFKNIEYYISGLPDKNHMLTPGIMYNNPSFVESYTSDGGAYWGAKVFFAIFIPDEHPFWQSEVSEYPIEQHDFMIGTAHPDINWVVEGNGEFSGITLYNNVSHYYQNNKFLHHFNDMGAYYSKFAYNSRCAFAVSCKDITSFDNMISLGTSDQLMYSHRFGFENLGERDGMLLSYHRPFSNDPRTKIETVIIPLPGGMHARVHRVMLGGAYVIREGGFCVPFYEDDFLTSAAIHSGKESYSITTPQMKSSILYLSELPVHFYMEMPKPGNHALAPMAGYPAIETQELPPGVYYVASAYQISVKQEKEFEEIKYDRKDDCIKISVNKNSWTMDFDQFFAKKNSDEIIVCERKRK